MEYKIKEITQIKHQTQRQMKLKKKYCNIWCLWDNIKHANTDQLHYRGLKEERKKGINNRFERRMTRNFSNLKKETNTQAQEAQTKWT